MAEKHNEELKQFIIPENFMDESRIFQGQLKTRNVVECVLIFGTLALFFWTVLKIPFTLKVSVVIFLSSPLAFLALMGINGDPLSTFIKMFFTWRKKCGLMLFNNETRALKEAPVKLLMESDGMGDKLRDMLDSRKEKKAMERAQQEFVEGKTFEFAPDDSLVGNYLDEYENDESGQDKPKGKKLAPANEVELVDEQDEISLTSDDSMDGQPDELVAEPENNGMNSQSPDDTFDEDALGFEDEKELASSDKATDDDTNEEELF